MTKLVIITLTHLQARRPESRRSLLSGLPKMSDRRAVPTLRQSRVTSTQAARRVCLGVVSRFGMSSQQGARRSRAQEAHRQQPRRHKVEYTRDRVTRHPPGNSRVLVVASGSTGEGCRSTHRFRERPSSLSNTRTLLKKCRSHGERRERMSVLCRVEEMPGAYRGIVASNQFEEASWETCEQNQARNARRCNGQRDNYWASFQDRHANRVELWSVPISFQAVLQRSQVHHTASANDRLRSTPQSVGRHT